MKDLNYESEQENQSMWSAIFALGVNFFLQGKYKKARIIFDGLRALDKEEPLSSVAYGEILMLEGSIEKALKHFLTLSKRFNKEGKVLLGAAKACILLNKIDDAKKLLQPIMTGEIPSTTDATRIAKLIYAQNN